MIGGLRQYCFAGQGGPFDLFGDFYGPIVILVVFSCERH